MYTFAVNFVLDIGQPSATWILFAYLNGADCMPEVQLIVFAFDVFLL